MLCLFYQALALASAVGFPIAELGCDLSGLCEVSHGAFVFR